MQMDGDDLNNNPFPYAYSFVGTTYLVYIYFYINYAFPKITTWLEFRVT